MTDRLVIGDRGATDLKGSAPSRNGAGLSTGRTGLRITEFRPLLTQRRFQGPLGDGAGGVDGDLLDRIEIGVEIRAIIAKGAAGDDFAPAVGQVMEFGVLGRSGLLERHGKSHLELGKNENLGKSS